MKTVPLADVLWTAANQHLDHRQALFLERADLPIRFLTCNAVARALDPSWWWMNLPVDVRAFLASLGCHISNPDAFAEATVGEERQGVRYMWLLLAMHVAESEGIMVEVQE